MFIRFNRGKWNVHSKTFVKQYTLMMFLMFFDVFNTYTMCMNVWCGQGTRYNQLYT